MKFKDHEAHRLWILEALKQLRRFVTLDPDFRGNRAYQQKAISYQYEFTEDGKYRVVFLGAFNVGKSTAINAFLGGAYLPMDVEECTSRLTFIQRGDEQRLLLGLLTAASSNELEALRHVLANSKVRITTEKEDHVIRIAFEEATPESMCKCLEPLVTVMADEDFPHLSPLREKIEELNLYLPTSVLEEDIVIVDTPGVHSVSETRQEITYGIIEHSHLVINLVDSNFVGNVHDLNFIKRIITLRGRRVFFVLNKADKLENDEIDMRFSRGPARSMIEAFRRHDIPEDSDIFFLSGYRALRAQQLVQHHLDLPELLDDNRLSLPTTIASRLESSDDPIRDLSAYLMGQSRLPHLKERLLDYLLNENKAGAVVETACRFILERGVDFVASFDNELKLAKDPQRFEALRKNREELIQRLEAIRDNAEEVLALYRAKSGGGEANGELYPGYERRFRDLLQEEEIRSHCVAPILDWLREEGNLKEARRSKFKTLAAQTEHQVDQFVTTQMKQIHALIQQTETEVQEAIKEQLGKIRSLRMQMTEPGRFKMLGVEASMTGSYMAFGASGAALGVATGAMVGSVLPVIGSAIGAGLGGLVGALGGLIARLAWSEERWVKRLEPTIRENVMNMLILGGQNEAGETIPSVLDSVLSYLKERKDAFEKAVREEVDNAIASVEDECNDLLAREREITEERDAVIARLQPKVDMLYSLRDRAQEIIEETNQPQQVVAP